MNDKLCFDKEELKLIYDALAIRLALVPKHMQINHEKKYQMFEDIRLRIKDVIE
jgi:hypothetical protein